VTGAEPSSLDLRTPHRHLPSVIPVAEVFMNGLRAVLLGSCVAVAALASAQAARLVAIVPVANSTATIAYGINDDNVIAGGFLDGDGVEHAFFGTPDGQYTIFDAGEGGTEARGINLAGFVVGMSNSQSGDTAAQPILERKPDGTLLSVTRAGVQLFGWAQQINSSDGRFAGTYWDFNNHQAVAFVGQDGKWRGDVKISEVHQASTARGIDSAGDVAGSYFRPPMHGYLLSNKVLTTIDYPAARTTQTEIEGINDNGQAVGQWVDRKGTTHSFLLDIASSTFTDVRVKGAAQVQAWAINNNGVVVLDSDLGPFLWCEHKRTCPGGGTFVSAPAHRVPKR
jgi:uncharacterized membrane protein